MKVVSLTGITYDCSNFLFHMNLYIPQDRSHKSGVDIPTPQLFQSVLTRFSSQMLWNCLLKYRWESHHLEPHASQINGSSSKD